eukprot:5727581-Prymnesium_polylepis.2
MPPLGNLWPTVHLWLAWCNAHADVHSALDARGARGTVAFVSTQAKTARPALWTPPHQQSVRAAARCLARACTVHEWGVLEL